MKSIALLPMIAIALNTGAAFGKEPSQRDSIQKEVVQKKDLTWMLKSYVQVEGQTDLAELTDAAKRAEELKIQVEADKSIWRLLEPIRSKVSAMSRENPQAIANAILQASADLQPLLEKLKTSFPNIAVNAVFLLTPWEKGVTHSPRALMTNDPKFADLILANMNEVQRTKYGHVSQGKDAMYFLGAVGTISLDKSGGEARLQIVTSLNPQEIAGENPLVIQAPDSPTKSTVMFIDVAQPLALQRPKLKFTFGRLDRLSQKGFNYNFNVMDEDFCARNRSVPSIIQMQKVPMINWKMKAWLPLYAVEFDTETQLVTSSDVRMGNFETCFDLNGYVPGKFQTTANQKVQLMKAALSELLAASPDQFAEIIAKRRAAAGLSVSNEE